MNWHQELLGNMSGIDLELFSIDASAFDYPNVLRDHLFATSHDVGLRWLVPTGVHSLVYRTIGDRPSIPLLTLAWPMKQGDRRTPGDRSGKLTWIG